MRQGDGDGRGRGSAAGSDDDDSGVPQWNPSPAARVAEEPNGAEGAKRRQRERERGSKKRCLLASQLSLVRNSAAVRIELKSAVNGMTAPLSIDDAPSEDLMSLLLKNALEPHWEQFTLANTRTAKADGRRRSEQETWLSETRADMHSHISKRADFEEQARRCRTLLFLLTVRSELGLAVAYEEECPGLARDLLGKDVLIMGAFSHSLDSVQHGRGSSRGNEARKAGGLSAELTGVARRKEGHVTKPGAEGAKDGLIKKTGEGRHACRRDLSDGRGLRSIRVRRFCSVFARPELGCAPRYLWVHSERVSNKAQGFLGPWLTGLLPHGPGGCPFWQEDDGRYFYCTRRLWW